MKKAGFTLLEVLVLLACVGAAFLLIGDSEWGWFSGKTQVGEVLEINCFNWASEPLTELYLQDKAASIDPFRFVIQGHINDVHPGDTVEMFYLERFGGRLDGLRYKVLRSHDKKESR